MTIYFDLETGGLDVDSPIIQIAAVAVSPDWEEMGSFEKKLQFSLEAANPEALKMNSYDADVWGREAVPISVGLGQFSEFMRDYSSVEMTSKRTGSPYSVCRLAGYNAATFDGPMLKHAFQSCSRFLPAHPQVLCVLQRAHWWFLENPGWPRPKSMRLGDVCERFGVEIENAHDALGDVRATVNLAREIAQQQGAGAPS